MQIKDKINKRENTQFQLQDAADNILVSILNCNDIYQMNWVAEGKRWGEMRLPEGISGNLKRKITEDGRLRESYTFCNITCMDYFFRKNEIGIVVPFPDNYMSADVCMTNRCHAHIWCGGNTAYIYGLRMGGRAPHLGLILCQGEIDKYSLERNEKALSNDRGTIILHPKINYLKPGENYEISWDLFWFDDLDMFNRRMREYTNVIDVQFDKTIHFTQEISKMKINCAGTGVKESDIKILRNGKSMNYILKETDNITELELEYQVEKPEEENWEIKIGAYHTWARTLGIPDIHELARKRCDFIVEKQQYRDEDSKLYGAFLIYDNEEKCQFYSMKYDHNAGRERVAMGVLTATWLQYEKNPKLEEALELYHEYIYRELYDEMTGIVYNEAGRNNDWHRLYNYPWMAVFFMECYKLYGKTSELNNMYKVMRTYYQQGGQRHYAIGIPIVESVKLLKATDETEHAEELTQLYRKQADYIAETGLHYPAHEVNYEQSIVAPAVNILLQVYELSGEERYLKAAVEQLKILELFNGHQPDYHLYETAVRHWDGYWFGKGRTLGDTFPHYWSALTGLAFRYYAKISGDAQYQKKAENSLRGVLSMIHADGSASCAYVYPAMVNGQSADYSDPWANDQDWALYFYLREGEKNYEK